MAALLRRRGTDLVNAAGVPRRNDQPAASNDVQEPKCGGETDSLAAIVAACQRGERPAQRRLYDACHQNVFRLAVRMVGLQDAADVTQQVFLQAFRSIGQFHGRSRFQTWLYRLAVNESLQHLRRKQRGRYHSLRWEPEYESHDAENVERREVLQKALARIDPVLRSIFLLREVEELSYREIGEALQIPEGTVGSRLNRARSQLRQHVAELGAL